MVLATITAKGQVTIPKTIRESLGLNAGDKIDIVTTAQSEAVLRPVSKKVNDVYRKLQKSGAKAVSIAAMNDAVKKRLRDTYQ